MRSHIVLRVIAGLIACFFAYHSIGHALGDTLSPASRFNSIPVKGTGFAIADLDNSVNPNEGFSGIAEFVYISKVIGKYLKLGISSNTLIQDLKVSIGSDEMSIKLHQSEPSFVIKFSNIFYEEDGNVCSIPVYEDGLKTKTIKFYIRGDIKIEKNEETKYHVYTEIDGKERDEIFQEILSDVERSIEKYYSLFRERLTGEKQTDIFFPKGYSIKTYKNQLYEKRLFRDENDVLWILKKINRSPGDKRKIFFGAANIPEQEMLGYLLARTRANFTEIRFLNEEEMRGIEYFKFKMDLAGEYYLTRVITEKNVEIDKLVDQDLHKANSALFVAYIFMRKWDPHLFNVARKKGIPVAVDHDAVMQQKVFPNTKIGLMRYHFNYIRNTIMRIADDHEGINAVVTECMRNIQKKRDIGQVEEGYHEAISTLGKKIRESGLGDAFIRAEMLEKKYIEESIKKFKDIEDVRRIVKEAGFSDAKLEEMVSLIKENQARLGRDVNELLNILTGRDYGFDKLDSDVPKKKSNSQSLFEEFKKRFPKNYEMMLSMFGESVIRNENIKKYFYKLMSCYKGRLSKKRAVYFASLLRIEEGFTPGEYKLRYSIEKEGEEMTFGSVAFNEIEDDFLKWAINKNILLKDFSTAYSLYVKKKEQMVHLREYGEKTKMTIRAGKKMGEELYQEFMESRTSFRGVPYNSYKGDVVGIENIRWLKRPKNVSEDIQIGVVDRENRDGYDIYIFTSNRNFIDEIGKQVQREFGDMVPIGYAEIRIEENVPVIMALQPRFYLPHYSSEESKKYVEKGISLLAQTVEEQIQEIVQPDSPVKQIRYLTAAWYLVNSKLAESTAQRYYMDVPVSEGYSLVALDEPIMFSGFFKVNFVYEKDIAKNEDRPFSDTETNELDPGTEVLTIMPKTIDGREQQKYAEMFNDIVKLIQARERNESIIFVLGTSWIKGYIKDKQLQYDALNPLVSSIRRFCEDKGIPFITEKDKDIIRAINEAKVLNKDAKVVVLAGKEIIEDENFKKFIDDDKIFFAGVDNSKLTDDSYVRIMEMMTLTLNLAFGREIDIDGANILIQKSDRFSNVYIFVPNAEPMDYETLKEIYRAQIFA